jgi:hypothetical protein
MRLIVANPRGFENSYQLSVISCQQFSHQAHPLQWVGAFDVNRRTVTELPYLADDRSPTTDHFSSDMPRRKAPENAAVAARTLERYSEPGTC